MRKLMAFAFMLVSAIALTATAAELKQLYSKVVPAVCWSLSVSNEGVVSAVEVDGTDTALTPLANWDAHQAVDAPSGQAIRLLRSGWLVCCGAVRRHRLVVR